MMDLADSSENSVALGDWDVKLATAYQPCSIRTADASLYTLQDVVYSDDDGVEIDYKITSGPRPISFTSWLTSGDACAADLTLLT